MSPLTFRFLLIICTQNESFRSFICICSVCLFEKLSTKNKKDLCTHLQNLETPILIKIIINAARFLGWNVLNGFRVPVTPFSYFISVPTVTNSAAILVCRRVTGSAPYRDLRSNGTTFYLSENPLFSPPKFNIPNFFI